MYLSVDTVWTPDDLRLGAAAHSGDVGPGQTYTGTANVVLPGVLPGSYYFLVRANWQNELYEGNALLNNAVASTATIAMDLPELTIGVARTGSLTKTGEAKTYKVQVAAGSDLTIRLTGPAAAAHELYVQYGAAPSRQSFDDRGIRPNSADQVVSVPSAQGGTYYVLVYGAKVPAGDAFTLTAELAEFAITSVTPAQASRLGQASLAIAGAQFAPGATARLVDGGGNRRDASAVYFTDTGLLTATLDLRGLAPGTYDVQVENPGGGLSTAAGAFQVIDGVPGQLSANLITPSAVRVGRNAEFLIEYTNTGNTDLLAPVLRVASTDALPIRLSPNAIGATSLQVIAVNPQGPAGILPPGQTGRITLYGYAAAPGSDTVDLFVGEYPATPIDWATLGPTLRPADLSDAEWAPLLAEIQSLVGVTWADYHAALSDAVTLLPPDSGGGRSVTEAFLLIEDQARANLGLSASGRVTLADSQLPVVGAEVLLVNIQTGEPFAARTFSDGTFLIPQIAAGTYAARVDGYSVVTAPEVVIGSADANDVAVTVQPGATISGYLVQAGTGAPLGDQPVSAVADTGAAYSVTSATAGRYTLTGLSPGTYRIEAGGGSYATAVLADVVVTAGQVRSSINLVLDVGATLSGTVTGPAGVIEGAQVSAAAADGTTRGAVTSATGQYTIAGLADGTYTLYVSAPTAAGTQREGVVVAGGEALTGVDFVLGPAGGLSITTRDAAGMPLPYVSVLVQGGASSAVTVTGPDGTALVTGLEPGEYTVAATVDTHTSGPCHATVTAGEATPVTLDLVALGMISGTVMDSLTGSPVARVVVRLNQDGRQFEHVVADATGRFQFSGLATGTYELLLGGLADPAVVSTKVILDAGHLDVTANLSVAVAGIVSGTVLGSDGTTPLVDAVVHLLEAGSSILQMATDSDGHYSFVVLSAGIYSLEAFAPELAFPPLSGITVGGGGAQAGLDFRPGTDIIRGTVRDRGTGQPVVGADVAIATRAPTWASSYLLKLTTDAAGQFRFPAAVPGSYRVAAAASGLAASFQTIDVLAGVPTEADFELAAGASLSGTVTQATNGTAVAGAMVQLVGVGAPDLILTASTDTDGTYVLSDLPPGDYTLVVSTTAGHEALVLADVHLAAGEATRDLALAPADNALAGTVDNAIGPLADAAVFAVNPAGLVLGQAISAADGSYQITGLPPDTYVLRAVGAGYRRTQLAGVTVADGQQVQGLVLRLSAVAIADPPGSAAEETSGQSNWWLTRAEFDRDPRTAEFRERHEDALQRISAIRPCPGESTRCTRAREEGYEVLTMAKLLYEDEVLKARTAMEAARDKFQKLAESLTDAALALVSDAVKALEGFSSRSLVTDADKALLNDFFRKENFSISDPPTSVFLPRVELLSIADAGRSGFVDWGRALASLDALMTQRFGIPALEAFVQRMQAKLPKPSSVDSVVIDVLTGGEALLWLNCQEFLDKLAAIHKSLDEIRPAIQDLSTYEQGLRKYLDALKRGRTSLRYLETNCVHSDSGIWLSDFWPPWPFGSSASSAAPPAPAAACCAASAAESTGPTCRGRCPPLPPPSERKVDSAHVQESTSVDPNAKFGPAAFGPDGFLQPGLLVYEIEFENDPQAGATIPAQEVWITDTLDGDLDLATVEFTGFGFNNLDFAVPAGLSHYETTLDLRPYGMDLLVPVQLDVNATTRVLSAYFGSRDPRTGQLPDALDAGFLPVNDKPLHNGEGYLRYRVRPRAGLPSGTVITNRADIKFDVNAIIPTPETKHTLDVGAPSSQVAALPSMSPTSFAVTWQGSDDAGGSGIAGFDVLVSTDGGPFLAWQTATANTSAVFVGQIGHSYRFYSIATDNVGHREAVPENPDAHTAVSGNLWHNAANRFDVSGSNDVTAQDVLLIINYINKHPGDQSLPAPPATPPPYYDVTDDGLCTANDALLVINEINRRLSPTGAGEADGEDPAAAAVVVVVALPRAARGDYPTEPQPTAASAAGLAVSPTRGESATWTGRRDREAAPLPVQAAGRDGGLAGTQPVLAARRVWTPRTLEELDAAFSLWDDLLPLRAVDLLVA